MIMRGRERGVRFCDVPRASNTTDRLVTAVSPVPPDWTGRPSRGQPDPMPDFAAQCTVDRDGVRVCPFTQGDCRWIAGTIRPQ